MPDLQDQRIRTLADWQPDAPAEALDPDALTAELLHPAHSGLRHIIAEVMALPADGVWSGEQSGRFQALARDAAAERTGQFLAETLRRLPFVIPAWKSWIHAYPKGPPSWIKEVLDHCVHAVKDRLWRPDTQAVVLDLPPGQADAALRDAVKLLHPAQFVRWYGRNYVDDPVLEALCRLAVQRGSADGLASLDRLLKQLGALGWDHVETCRAIAEKVVAITGQDRRSVPFLRAFDAEVERRQALRQRVLDAAGPTLAPVVRLVLEGLASLATHPPRMAALLRQSPAALGQTLLTLVGLLDLRATLGLTGWAEINPRLSRFELCPEGDREVVRGFSDVAALILRRKLELADTEVARLLRAAPRLDGLQSRPMLNLALKTAQAHPDGETATLLRAAVGGEAGAPRLPDGWRAIIEARLGGARAPLGSPKAKFDFWDGGQALAAQFSHLFDRRLQEREQRGFLADFTKQAAAFLEKARRLDSKALRERLHDKGLTTEGAAAITAQLDAVAPFVARHPGIAPVRWTPMTLLREVFVYAQDPSPVFT